MERKHQRRCGPGSSYIDDVGVLAPNNPGLRRSGTISVGSTDGGVITTSGSAKGGKFLMNIYTPRMKRKNLRRQVLHDATCCLKCLSIGDGPICDGPACGC